MTEWKRCYGCMEQREDWDGQGYCPFCGFYKEDYKAGNHILPLGTKLLGGRYIIGKKLSKGGFGITYIGWDTALAHKVAIKEYYPSELVDRNITISNNVTIQDKKELVDRERKSFLDEAKILYSLSSCRGIVHIENIIEDENDTSYIIMELLEGITLKEYRDQQPNKQMSFKETLRIMEPVIKSMQEVHKKGVIHRDISPDNIMLCNNLEVKLLDFGAARQQDRTQFTAIMKVEFAPPEQRYRKPGEDERSRSLKQQGPWTDVYALCATIYYLVAGKAAESAQARACHMLEEGQDTLVPLSQWNDDVDAYMDSVIQKGMAMKIKNRYQSMEELYRALYLVMENNTDPSVKEEYQVTERFVTGETTAEHNEIPTVKKVKVPETTGAQIPVKALKQTKQEKEHKKTIVPFLVVVGALIVGIGIVAVLQMRVPSQNKYAGKQAGVPLETTAKTETAEPVLYQMVNVTGLKKKDATGELKEMGCKSLKVVCKGKYSSETPKGRVISQSLDQGTQWREGEDMQITLVVSKGEQLYRVPKVIGNSEAVARQKLKKAKMIISVVEEYNTSYGKGKIIRQSIAGNKKVKKGKEITITVSKGAKPVVTQSSTSSSGTTSQGSSGSSGQSSGSSGTSHKTKTTTTKKTVLPPM